MNAAPGHAAEIIFTDPGSYPNIPGIETGGEWMFGNILAPCFKIESDRSQYFQAEFPLGILVKILVKELIIHLIHPIYFVE